MLGGRDLGVTIGAGLGKEGTEAPRSILGGDSSMCKDLEGNKIMQTPTFTNLSLFAYII